jgi:hypothetical protein
MFGWTDEFRRHLRSNRVKTKETTTFTGDHPMSATLLRSATIDAPRSSRTATHTSADRPSRRRVIAGRVLTVIVALFLTFDAGFKLVAADSAAAASAQLGFTPEQVFVIGIIAAVCLVLYLVPRTAPLGAVLWTGYFGGAIVTHFRVDNPLLTHTLFPIYVAALIWGSLYLRDPRVRAAIRAVR